MNLTRKYWLHQLLQITEPVLRPLSEGKLREQMPIESHPGMNDRADYTYLEAFGRSLAGLAPWLAAQAQDPAEEAERRRVLALAARGLERAVHPDSPDKMNFLDGTCRGNQPIVDAAFLALGLLRAWEPLWTACDADTQANLITAMKATRSEKAPYNNWLLFSAVIEAFLYRAEGNCDTMRVDFAIKEFTQHWYLGDGQYGDGTLYAFNYYNSYVIHPMLMAVLDTLSPLYTDWQAVQAATFQRAARYAQQLENLIAPDGSFPAIGRSITYRMGTFHLLADIALRHLLPQSISPASVRCAMTAVLHRCMDAPGTFDKNHFLTIGLCGHQPGLGEPYISTGSLYLCTSALLPLGLPESDPFWSGADEPWSGVKIWSGEDYPADHLRFPHI